MKYMNISTKQFLHNNYCRLCGIRTRIFGIASWPLDFHHGPNLYLHDLIIVLIWRYYEDLKSDSETFALCRVPCLIGKKWPLSEDHLATVVVTSRAESSVTRLGDFLKFLATKFLPKEAQMIGNFLDNFEILHSYVKTSLATF